MQRPSLSHIILFLGVVLIATGCRKNYLPDPAADTAKVAKYREEFSKSVASGESGAATQVAGTGWATIKGSFKIKGNKPEIKALAGGGQGCPSNIPDNEVIIDDATKGIAFVGIYADKVNRTHESYANYEPPVFDQKDCMFLSPLFIFKAGAPYVIKNSDSVAHNVASEFENVTIGPGESAEKTNISEKKAKKNPVRVNCSIHGWMKAYFLPLANPYYATTKTDGTFEIANVPAGEDVVFKIWHPRTEGKISVKGTGGEIKNGKLTVKLKENEPLVLDFEIPAEQFGGK